MTEPGWTDSHVHVVDFLQRPAERDPLRRALLDAGASRAVIFGLPVKKKWAAAEPLAPGYYLDDNARCHYHSLTDMYVLDAVADLERDTTLTVAPLVCGFDPTDRLVAEHLDAVWSRSPRWAGVGEVLLRHDDLTNLTVGETPVADHPAMDGVLDFCAQHHVPISIHHDSSSAGRPARHEYLPPLEAALRRHRGTTVVWCHAGVSRRVAPHGQHQVVTDMLTEHPNLIVELSWVVLDHLVDPHAGVDPHWVSLIENHPERVVIGTDTVADPTTITDRGTQIRALLDALSPQAHTAVAHQTATRLWFNR